MGEPAGSVGRAVVRLTGDGGAGKALIWYAVTHICRRNIYSIGRNQTMQRHKLDTVPT